MKRVKKVLSGMMVGLMIAGMAFAQSPQEPLEEVITIETFFPAPWAEVDELRLYPSSRDYAYCIDDRRGTMYYDEVENKVKVCKGVIDGWQELGGGFWTASDNDIYNSNSGNVGIGTASPGAMLDVNGSVKFGDDTGTCDSAKAGVMRWTGLSLDICGNNKWRLIKSFASAAGGTITNSEGYRIHTFLNNGTFTPNGNMNVEYLVVAGGGGGGGIGGGGAGGYRTGILEVTAQAYAITVGAGGTGLSAPSKTNGGNSIFSSITATGGGSGGGEVASAAAGGSGGGGPGSGPAGAASPAGQGSAGGTGRNNGAGTAFSGGGGGGAGGGGLNASGSGTAGNGGIGRVSSIDVTIRAGGGGGGSYIYTSTGTAGMGGSGGGGNGGRNGLNATAGAANTGGGGGGAGLNSSGNLQGPGGAGGSGIVIIRYLGE